MWLPGESRRFPKWELYGRETLTMEGDTTNFYIYRKLEKMGVKLSVIARGISVGDELEYADEVTLGRSIVNRTLFTGTN